MNKLRLKLPPLPVAEMQEACAAHDVDYDSVFYAAVRTTGIVCRPSCPSRPKRENLEFFASLSEALAAGYRPCKRCQPELANGHPPLWIKQLMERVTAEPGTRITSADLRSGGLTPERVRRWFKENEGMTFAVWCRGQRLSQAHHSLRSGAPLDDVILGHGYDSHSGFREAFRRVFGAPPGRSREGKCLRVALLPTPLGPMLAAESQERVCFLEFASQNGLEAIYAELRKHFNLPLVPGDSELLRRLKRELREYFGGCRQEFTTAILLKGTPFQEQVWGQLRRIPCGQTASYADIAKRVERPKAVRAVAQANAANRLAILVPCHRVIGSDGQLSGYAGGVWRKRLLLDLERHKKM